MRDMYVISHIRHICLCLTFLKAKLLLSYSLTERFRRMPCIPPVPEQRRCTLLLRYHEQMSSLCFWIKKASMIACATAKGRLV